MIEFRDVGKSYRSVKALDGVSLCVERGSVFGFIGPNGAGKTTSIKILTGMIRDYEGSVLIDGKPLEQERASFHRRVGYLPQTAGFQEWRTVRHALSTFGRLSGIGDAELTPRIARVAERLGLIDVLDRKIVHLSGGMQQRLRFAQAILHEPEVVILDEPLSGLDPSSRAELKRTIRELATEGHTIVLTSHVLSDVEDLASFIAIIDHGTIRDSGTREELRERHNVGTLVELRGSGVRDHADTLAAIDSVAGLRTGETDATLLEIDPHADIDEALHAIMRAIVDDRVPVRSLRHVQPSLEDVYLSLTEVSRE